MALVNRAREPVPLERMKRLPRVGDLDLDQLESSTRREGRVQRVGMVAMATIPVAALAGGSGPVAETVASSPEGLWVEYPRLARHDRTTDVNVRIPSSPVRNDMVQVEVGRRWFEGQKVEAITPEPEQSRAREETMTFSCRVVEGPLSVQLSLGPNAMGLREGHIAVPGGGLVDLDQFVSP